MSGGGEIKERRGGPLDEAGVRVAVSPKEERKEREWEMRGGPVQETTVRGREPTGRQKKGKAHSAQGWRVRHDATAT